MSRQGSPARRPGTTSPRPFPRLRRPPRRAVKVTALRRWATAAAYSDQGATSTWRSGRLGGGRECWSRTSVPRSRDCPRPAAAGVGGAEDDGAGPAVADRLSRRWLGRTGPDRVDACHGSVPPPSAELTSARPRAACRPVGRQPVGPSACRSAACRASKLTDWLWSRVPWMGRSRGWAGARRWAGADEVPTVFTSPCPSGSRCAGPGPPYRGPRACCCPWAGAPVLRRACLPRPRTGHAMRAKAVR